MTTRRSVIITGSALAVAATLPAQAQDMRPQVLFVDGEPALRRVVPQLLGWRGYAVTTAATGHEALREIQVTPGRFDLMIVETALPDMSGVEVVRVARDIGLRDAPALLVRFSVRACNFAWADDRGQVVTEPLSMFKLTQRMRTALGRA